MVVYEDKAGPGSVGLRIGGTVAGVLILLLAVLALVRPDLMSMATIHRAMAAMGF